MSEPLDYDSMLRIRGRIRLIAGYLALCGVAIGVPSWRYYMAIDGGLGGFVLLMTTVLLFGSIALVAAAYGLFQELEWGRWLAIRAGIVVVPLSLYWLSPQGSLLLAAVDVFVHLGMMGFAIWCLVELASGHVEAFFREEQE